MALTIRNPEAEELAAELAQLSGTTKTEAVTVALRDRRLPAIDPRSADEILDCEKSGW